MGELTTFEKMGVLGIALAILFFGYKTLQLVAAQWKNSNESQDRSTDALNRNTASFEKLSQVFEKQAERDLEFQKSVTQILSRNTSLLTSTHRKVSELHGAVVLRRRANDPAHNEDPTSEGDEGDEG